MKPSVGSLISERRPGIDAASALLSGGRARGQGQHCLAQESRKEGNTLLLEYKDHLSVRTGLTGMPQLPSKRVVCDTVLKHVHEYSLLSNPRGCL